jgi:hypothetical protein
MNEQHTPPTQQDYQLASSLHSMLIAACLVSMAVMVIGLALADSWMSLLLWLCAANCALPIVCLVAFLAGHIGGRHRG